MAFEPLKFIIKKSTQGGVRHLIQSSLITEYMKKLLIEEFGKGVEADIKNILLKKDTLVVQTNSTPLAHQIQMHSRKYQKAINSKFGENLVKKISFSK